MALKLRSDYREHLAVMVDLLADMEERLDSPVFDRADLEPALSEARKAVGRAKAFVSEIHWTTG